MPTLLEDFTRSDTRSGVPYTKPVENQFAALNLGEFSRAGLQYVGYRSSPDCWVMTGTGGLPEESLSRVVLAISENRLDDLLVRWVVTSIGTAAPNYASIGLRHKFFYVEQADHLREARIELNRLRGLKKNWDTYGAEPIGEAALSHAGQVIDIVVDTGGATHSVQPTVESSVFIRSSFPKGVIEFEVDESDIVGVAIKVEAGETSYHDIAIEALAMFLKESLTVGG